MYSEYFLNLLSHEVSAQHKEFRKYDLFNVPIYIQEPSQSLYRLAIPGIRENNPPVQLGDVVKLRQVRQPGYMGMGGTFTGYQYDACIYGMDKTVGYIVLRVDHLVLESGRFNVCFVVQEKQWTGATRAIEDLGAELRGASSREATGNPVEGTKVNGTEANNKPGVFVRRMLFPEKEDGIWQTTLSRGIFKRRWFDGELNYEQQVRVVFRWAGITNHFLCVYFHGCIIAGRICVLVDELYYDPILLWTVQSIADMPWLRLVISKEI